LERSKDDLPAPRCLDGLTASPRSIRINGADCGAEALILGVVTSIGGFLFGYDTGQISGMLLFSDFKNRFGQEDTPEGRDFIPIIESLVVSLMSIGTLVGALTAS
jgi:SP family sugar:H+ symporter-like MFS transporter